jgi:phosphatidate cytidylyltransferase
VNKTPTRNSDLGVRTVSAVVMLAVSGAALWLGGWAWLVFVGLVTAGAFFEWQRLAQAISASLTGRLLWSLGGMAYFGIAAATLLFLRELPDLGMFGVLLVLLPVIATDVGAYFAGRAIGGPKIAPSLSPSKTWAGLIGGMLASGLVLALATSLIDGNMVPVNTLPLIFSVGAALAVVAQAGDFFESWMKRRAGVKDSGRLIPGHGGLFDRVDGLIAVLFALGLAMLLTVAFGLASGGELLPTPA